MNTKTIKNILQDIADVVSFRNNIFTVKKSYYWGFGKDGSEFADKIQKMIPNAKIVDYGNHWHAFVGGAKPGSPQDSYYFCKFQIPQNA